MIEYEGNIYLRRLYMKKLFCAVCFLLVLAFVFCSCGEKSKLYEINGENAWYAYPVENAPVKAVNAGEKWYLLKGIYLGTSFTLAVGSDYLNTKDVYAASGVDIWFFEANERLAAWSEIGGEGTKFMVYNAESGKAEQVFSVSTEAGFAPANVGVWGESVYFAHIDYAAEKAAVMRYDLDSGALSCALELEYRGESSCTSLSVDGGVLLVSAGGEGKAELIRADLASGKRESIPLASGVEFVYGCAYDAENGGYALYYRDGEGEYIGTVNAKNGKVKIIATFPENVYAYRDTLELYGGHLYWVQQINASGNVAEHYKFIDYDIGEGTSDEYLRTFSFTLASDGVTLLSFNTWEYSAIYLTEIYLGGQ